MNKENIVLHLHDLFWPHNAGSTHRLASIIEQSKYKHIVLSRKEHEKRNVFKYRGILVIKYSSLFHLVCLYCYVIYRYRRLIRVIHSHNFRASLIGLIVPLSYVFDRILELHSIYRPTTIYGRLFSYFIYASHSKLILLSESSKDYISTKGKRVLTIYNPVEIELNPNHSQTETNYDFYEASSRFVENASFVYVYFGSFDSFQGIHNIKLFAKLLQDQDPGARILIAGGGAENSLVFENFSNVLHFENIPKSSIPLLYSLADYSMLFRDPTVMTQSAISLKILESLANGVSVISTNLKSSREVASLGCSQYIHFFDPPNYPIMRKSGRFDVEAEFLNKFSKSNASNLLDNFYES